MNETQNACAMSTPRAIVAAVRPHQWLKNLLVFVPIALAHRMGDADMMIRTVAGFVAFSLVASAGYIVNDLLDVESDRQHPRKRTRPFAGGTLSKRAGLVIIALAAGGGGVIAAGIGSWPFAGWLGLYLAMTITYSVYLKRKVIVDVLVLAGLYALRVLAGGAAADVAVSPWLIALSGFLFFSLALMKRYVELKMLDRMRVENSAGRGYRASDLNIVRSIGPASGYMAVLVLAIYMGNSQAVDQLYRRPQALWLVCPLLLYWVTRAWFLAERGQIDDDPVAFAIRDRMTWLIGACMVVLGVIAAL